MTNVMSIATLDQRVGTEKLAKVSELLRVAAHPQRLAILDAIGIDGRKCNRELQELLGIEQAILSQHLTLLKDRGVLECSKEGMFTFWAVKRPELLKIVNCLEDCCDKL
jgi:DNA-binding transcriptional ArsR family regulator